MKKLQLRALLSLVIGLAFSMGARAEPGPGGDDPGHGFERALRALDLTDEQSASIDSMRDEMRKDMAPLHRKLREKHEQMQRLWTAQTLDETAIMKLDEEIGALRAEIHKTEIELRIDIVTLLTPNQRTKLNEIMRKRAECARGSAGRPERDSK